VVDRLDGAFAILVDILDRHGGIVNKFLGDGFLALFGAPLEAPTRRTGRSPRRAKCWTPMRGSMRRRAGRCASASAFTSARWSPAVSDRRGARNTP
jgi:class 3 adenylate cyclase